MFSETLTRIGRAIVAALFLLCLAVSTMIVLVGPAEAATATGTWTAPSTRADGQAMPASEIGGYHIDYNCGTPKSVVVGPNENQHVFDLPAGTECQFTIAAFDTDGVMGLFSTPVSYTFDNGPAPPIFSITPDSSVQKIIDACTSDGACACKISALCDLN